MSLSREQFVWLGYYEKSLDIFTAVGSNEGHHDLVIAFETRFKAASDYLQVMKREEGMLCCAGVGYVLC